MQQGVGSVVPSFKFFNSSPAYEPRKHAIALEAKRPVVVRLIGAPCLGDPCNPQVASVKGPVFGDQGLGVSCNSHIACSYPGAPNSPK